MIGIYKDEFIDYLIKNLGDPVKVKSKNIVCRCPWCEYQKDKKHYHLYISLEAPIFHCFFGDCGESGLIHKLISKISGYDISNKYVDQDKVRNIQNNINLNDKIEIKRDYKIPSIDINKFSNKYLYIKKRLKFFNISISEIKGLIFDIDEFLNINDIPINQTLFRIRDFLHSNFVGFLTNNQSKVVFRNINDNSNFSYFKLNLYNPLFLDYYRIPGNNKFSKKIILAEGIFDIFNESLFDYINLKDEVSIYASALSSKYASLINSIKFYESIFFPDVIILSDNGISLDYYKKIKKFSKIDTLTVYYNKNGKDFGSKSVEPTKIIL